MRMIRETAAALLFVAVAGGTAVAQERPAPEPSTDRSVLERGAQLTEEPAADERRVPLRERHRQQGDVRQVTLDEAIQTALRNNPGLTQTRSQVEMARLERLDAVGDFLPSVDLRYGFSDASTGRLDPTGQAITTTNYSAQLVGSIELLDGFRRVNDLRSARRNVDARQAGYREREYGTILNVKTAYFNSVARRELVEVEEDRVRRLEDQLEFVRQQQDLGRATRSDVLRSRVDLNNARLALLTAENEARQSTFALAEAMGVRERVSPDPEAELEIAPLPYERQELERIALERGPAVQAARASTEAAEAAISSSRSAFLPSLSFSGGWAWQDADFPPRNRSWSLQLAGSLPLFNGFQREHQIARSQAQADIAREEERAVELSLRADLDEAYSQIHTARAAMEMAEESVELSQEDLRVTRERFRLGLATILDLQAAQIGLREAEVELVERRFDYQIGVARLEALLGQQLELQ